MAVNTMQCSETSYTSRTYTATSYPLHTSLVVELISASSTAIASSEIRRLATFYAAALAEEQTYILWIWTPDALLSPTLPEWQISLLKATTPLTPSRWLP